jgi:hypothetical protein
VIFTIGGLNMKYERSDRLPTLEKWVLNNKVVPTIHEYIISLKCEGITTTKSMAYRDIKDYVEKNGLTMKSQPEWLKKSNDVKVAKAKSKIKNIEQKKEVIIVDMDCETYISEMIKLNKAKFMSYDISGKVKFRKNCKEIYDNDCRTPYVLPD